jgi:hypothetical protein
LIRKAPQGIGVKAMDLMLCGIGCTGLGPPNSGILDLVYLVEKARKL